MKRNKAKTKNDFMRKYANSCEKKEAKFLSEQAKRMRNGSLFASFRFEAKKNISENRTPSLFPPCSFT
jgi:hypothetical protein